ncbi:MAG: hypothetical protein IJB16_05520, partial [Clostridia bacterium]|nr:hypothetical protein [Clostridia bacterium]
LEGAVQTPGSAGGFDLFSFPLFEDCFAFFTFAEADYVRKQGSHQCIRYVFRYARNHFGRLVVFSRGIIFVLLDVSR